MAVPISDRELAEAEMEDVFGLAQQCMDQLKIADTTSHKDILAILDDSIRFAQKNSQDYTDDVIKNIKMMAGALWGQVLVTALEWEWRFMEAAGGGKAYCVVSPNRAHMIYPFDFVEICIQKANVDITIELSFNMLVGGEIPDGEPDNWDNLMANVRHIVPPK